MRWILYLLLACSCAPPAIAGGNILVDKFWLSETVPRQHDTSVQLNLSVTQAARLISVSSPVAAGGEIQRFVRLHGTMEKRAIDSLKMPARSTVRFGAHNLYLVLTGLNKRLRAGDHVPIVLVLEIAGRQQTITADAEVKETDLSYQQYH
ncbi:MAG: copper chaperone PCu(A)C [Gallionella sp.]